MHKINNGDVLTALPPPSGSPSGLFSCSSANCWTDQITAAGEISYDGKGGATEIGVFSVTNHTTANGSGLPSTNAIIGNYSCDWGVDILDNATFELDGYCQVQTTAGEPPVFLTNQKWFGRISNKGDTLLVERHDIHQFNVPPEDFEGVGDNINTANFVERICGKTGVQIKLR